MADYFETVIWGHGEYCDELKRSSKSRNRTSIQQRRRTNNALRGWNGKLNKLGATKHPTIPKLIQKVKQEQKHSEIKAC